jgi:hypothetical protein
VDDDGIVFLPESIRVAKDRDGNDGNISGGKIVITALIHTARVEVRIDVGFGNVITPHVTKMKLPTLMPDIAPAPVISTYPMETVVSEKLHAIVQHGLINTRMKDFFDIMRISEMFEFDGDILRQAVESTFASLRRELPLDPIGLSDRMVAVNSKQWAAYVKRQGVETSQDYGEIMEKVARFIEPVIASSHGVSDPGDWHPDEGWSNQRSPQP